MKITNNNLQDIFKSKVLSVDTMQLKGYTLLENLMVDNSGFGRDDERAYTKSQFEIAISKILESNPVIYTAITNQGQFQVYVGVFIKTGKNTLEKIAGNTYQFYKNNVFTIRYHDTDIIKMVDDKIELNNGGWYSSTTKERINNFIYTYGYTLFQKNFQWYIRNEKNKVVSDYKNGMFLTTN